MKDRISALMDGELDHQAAGEAINALGREAEAIETWRTYHLISDAIRESRLLSGGFSARLNDRLSAEPTVLAPSSAPLEPRRWFVLPVAAAVAAVALVGWMAFAPQRDTAPVQAPVVAEVKPPVMVPLPTAANDYLLAHQGFSPRVSFQGIAPYVRTVSDPTEEPRK